MEITGTYTFEAQQDAVWNLLMDTDRIARCIPGCERLEPIGDNQYRTRLTVAIAAVSGSYDATVQLAHLDPPKAYHLLVDGQGRAGWMKGSAFLSLSDEGPQTIVHVLGDVQVGGAIARVGQRLIFGVARMLMDRFFSCLASELVASR
jgi:carbon monoxide dehydrogenase subunit G